MSFLHHDGIQIYDQIYLKENYQCQICNCIFFCQLVALFRLKKAKTLLKQEATSVMRLPFKILPMDEWQTVHQW